MTLTSTLIDFLHDVVLLIVPVMVILKMMSVREEAPIWRWLWNALCLLYVGLGVIFLWRDAHHLLTWVRS